MGGVVLPARVALDIRLSAWQILARDGQAQRRADTGSVD